MESQKRLWIARVLLGDAFYADAIFGGYAGRLLLPMRQAA
jgi:hypothetical protein